MSPDEMEAESLRYSAAAFFVLPLSSGRIAILTPRRNLFRIVADWTEAMAIGPLAEAQIVPPEVEFPSNNPLLTRLGL
jgi:hypothetical protein